MSFQRVINSPRRGIGDTTQGRIVGHANTMGEAVFDVALDPQAVPGLGTAAVKAVGRFMSTMESCATGPQSSVGDLLQETLADVGYIEALENERTIESQGRLREPRGAGQRGARVRRLGRGAHRGGVPPAGLAVRDQDAIDDDEGVVTLMTLHNAKGLEYAWCS